MPSSSLAGLTALPPLPPLPPLPAVSITLQLERQPPPPLIAAFAEHIRRALPLLQGAAEARGAALAASPPLPPAARPDPARAALVAGRGRTLGEPRR
ncbi:hypothetical protein EFP20_11725 [Burkholderia glumae]|uniref:hypothetical protein n=1 Tax=Burkholderia glumae TaxID=337 RepID=UPI0005F1BAAE|nr:hypothetical protein [Burkholderia glumae]PNL05572.1 hypothetical protein CEQ24_006665 [Burkholderia glumae]UVT02236.1 hypothetical protein EFP20_11725 [Burkholderia glumae]